MSKKVIVGLVTIAIILGFGAYILRQSSSAKMASAESSRTSQQTTILKGTSQDTGVSSVPQPPPRPVGEKPAVATSSDERSLIGTTTEQLSEVEKHLPAGSRIATYAVSETEQKAALATSDLIGDGGSETVVVYSNDSAPDGPALSLAVLTRQGSELAVRASAPLYGSLIYTSIGDQQAAPFVIRDVTGDRRPEIVVTSGVGASIGGAMQVYSFDGSSLNRLAVAQGHILRLYEKGAGQAAEITAQSRYEETARTYRWNGHSFASR
jgi:hypothetical protein